MGGLFSRPSLVTQQDKTILQLKCQRDRLTRYQARLDKGIQDSLVAAKQHASQKEDNRALICLKRRRCLQKYRSDTDASLLTLEQLVLQIEHASLQNDVVKALGVGNAFLQGVQARMPLETVEALMRDVEQTAAIQREIEETLGQVSPGVTDHDLEKELADLVAACGTGQTTGVKMTPKPVEETVSLDLNLPNVPKTEIILEQAKKLSEAKPKRAVPVN